jgi:hypothetical protein
VTPGRRFTVVLVAASLFVAACGGDDDGGDEPAGQATTTTQASEPETTTSAPSKSVTKEDYIARADAFCRGADARARESNERLKEAVEGASGEEAQLAAAVPVLRAGLEVQKRDTEEFQSIEPPREDAETIDGLHQIYDQRVAKVEQMLEAAEAGDADRFGALLQEANELKLRSRAIMRDYGFKECGSGKSDVG